MGNAGKRPRNTPIKIIDPKDLIQFFLDEGKAPWQEDVAKPLNVQEKVSGTCVQKSYLN